MAVPIMINSTHTKDEKSLHSPSKLARKEKRYLTRRKLWLRRKLLLAFNLEKLSKLSTNNSTDGKRNERRLIESSPSSPESTRGTVKSVRQRKSRSTKASPSSPSLALDLVGNSNASFLMNNIKQCKYDNKWDVPYTEKLLVDAATKRVRFVHFSQSISLLRTDAEGSFKDVRYVDNSRVIQTFRDMTVTQRTVEIVSFLTLKTQPYIGNILQIFHDDTSNQLIGLSMQRYEQTLKQYTHQNRLTPHQKLDLIRQMLLSVQCIHHHGIAHRDISEVNFMVDRGTLLADGSVAARVYLIDFGKATFTRPEVVRRWWVQPGSYGNDGTQYQDEVIPANASELDSWCAQLPWVSIKPDHGYRCYRSIQTLPRNRTDHDVLPWLVDPMAEDMYSIVVLIWKVFTESAPWHGVIDTDLPALRDMVDSDENIEFNIKRDVPGVLSRELLLMCLKFAPEDRATATILLDWIDTPHISAGLLEEWGSYHGVSSSRNKRRKLPHSN